MPTNAKKSKPSFTFSKNDCLKVFKRDAYSCQYCGSKPPTVILLLERRTPVSDYLDATCLGCILGKYDIPCCHDFFYGPGISPIKTQRG